MVYTTDEIPFPTGLGINPTNNPNPLSRNGGKSNNYKVPFSLGT